MALRSTSAPILGTTADGTASAESARGLLLTVLGELARPGGAGAWTRTLVTLLDGLAIKDKAVRQALSRMERPGWLERERHGRSVRWVLGHELLGQLESGGSRIYDFGQRRQQWNGSWLLLVPGDQPLDRATEFRLARALRWTGCGTASRGTWICPWVARRPEVLAVLDAHSVAGGSGASLFESKLAGLGADADLVAGAWDLDALGRQYSQFLHRFESVGDDADDPFAAATELVDLVHQWRKFPLIDPELPAELLPNDWSGHQAAALFEHRRRDLLPAAQQWWAVSEG